MTFLGALLWTHVVTVRDGKKEKRKEKNKHVDHEKQCICHTNNEYFFFVYFVFFYTSSKEVFVRA